MTRSWFWFDKRRHLPPYETWDHFYATHRTQYAVNDGRSRAQQLAAAGWVKVRPS